MKMYVRIITSILLFCLQCFPSYGFSHFIGEGDVRTLEFDEIILYYRATNEIIPRECERQTITFEYHSEDEKPPYCVVTYGGQSKVYEDSSLWYDSDSEETSVTVDGPEAFAIRHVPHEKGSKNGILIIYCKKK